MRFVPVSSVASTMCREGASSRAQAMTAGITAMQSSLAAASTPAASTIPQFEGISATSVPISGVSKFVTENLQASAQIVSRFATVVVLGWTCPLAGQPSQLFSRFGWQDSTAACWLAKHVPNVSHELLLRRRAAKSQKTDVRTWLECMSLALPSALDWWAF